MARNTITSKLPKGKSLAPVGLKISANETLGFLHYPSCLLLHTSSNLDSQALSALSPLDTATMSNLLKDLISMMLPQAKRPLQVTNRLSPAKQNVASGPFTDFAARMDVANESVTLEQQHEQAKIDFFVFVNMLR